MTIATKKLSKIQNVQTKAIIDYFALDVKVR